MSFEIKKRPFAIEPVTGIMMPDGIFDAAIPKQHIACYFTNTSDKVISGLGVWIKDVSDPGIIVPYEVKHAVDIQPGASVLLEFPASFINATPGKVDVTFAYNYSIGLGTHTALVGSLFNPLEIVKQIFVSETTYDDATKTYTCTVPEGTLQMKINSVIATKKLTKWKQPAFARKNVFTGPVLLEEVELTVKPSAPYGGAHGDLPFKDPWWKVVAAVVAVVAFVLAILAAVYGLGTAYFGVKGEDFVDLETGQPACYECERDNSLAEGVAGILSIVASIAFVIALADDADPFRRGQAATDPGAGVTTSSERVVAFFQYPERPDPGAPFKVKTKWQYERTTDQGVLKHSVSEAQVNQHAIKMAKIGVKKDKVAAADSVVLEARFYKSSNRKLKGDELYVNAMVVAPTGNMHRVQLSDLKNDGVYRASFMPAEVAAAWSLKADNIKGDWQAYVWAQDVNDADPGMQPEVAATHIGSYPVHTPFRIHIKPNPTCPEKPDAVVTVT